MDDTQDPDLDVEAALELKIEEIRRRNSLLNKGGDADDGMESLVSTMRMPHTCSGMGPGEGECGPIAGAVLHRRRWKTVVGWSLVYRARLCFVGGVLSDCRRRVLWRCSVSAACRAMGMGSGGFAMWAQEVCRFLLPGICTGLGLQAEVVSIAPSDPNCLHW